MRIIILKAALCYAIDCGINPSFRIFFTENGGRLLVREIRSSQTFYSPFFTLTQRDKWMITFQPIQFISGCQLNFHVSNPWTALSCFCAFFTIAV